MENDKISLALISLRHKKRKMAELLETDTSAAAAEVVVRWSHGGAQQKEEEELHSCSSWTWALMFRVIVARFLGMLSIDGGSHIG